MTGPGALHNMLINLESPDIVGVMQRVVSRDTFLTPRQLNDIDRMLNNTRGVTIHHKVFGQTYGFETGTEVLFSGQQVFGIHKCLRR